MTTHAVAKPAADVEICTPWHVVVVQETGAVQIRDDRGALIALVTCTNAVRIAEFIVTSVNFIARFCEGRTERKRAASQGRDALTFRQSGSASAQSRSDYGP